ncbi:hypothetical protein [Noviherbaspirillum saxi]|uniref:Lipoprotein n=1 Tax=Noviherbaspirillum saxi TaxID=2320863 RepID=A0A3A3FUU0_9BURK|nr:hypothetical protein [Noviherbaspirillum saxi]RJF99836.1 hypothetical protein D3871_15885 [Noviherbaspirillum saxi]
MRKLWMLGACMALLGGCGEMDQSKTAGTTNRSDVAPWQGAKNAYVIQGWSPGDQGSWETQLRTRGQLQNEYVKVN